MALVNSQSFVDYSTSGLENPFTHLLLVLFACVYLKVEKIDPDRLLILGAIVGLLLLNRMDLILLVGPALLWVLWYCRSWRTLVWLVVGASPMFFACDVGDRAQVERLRIAVEARWGAVDVLINNAGRGAYGRCEEADADVYDAVVQWQKSPARSSKLLPPANAKASPIYWGTRRSNSAAIFRGWQG
ncbi:MAG TPA: SDR family oxidoreductase [Candidatus Latescibacteria bacterium]|nr:SDR family oxidoreductase [Candidatus Handelsmanbacteria bacterium]HIL10601.1 SDR family oxidoreductase [Candidatus Latescibacterota bacterium]